MENQPTTLEQIQAALTQAGLTDITLKFNEALKITENKLSVVGPVFEYADGTSEEGKEELWKAFKGNGDVNEPYNITIVSKEYEGSLTYKAYKLEISKDGIAKLVVASGDQVK